MARNGVHSGGWIKAKYYKVWDKETGKYKGVWRISGDQYCMHEFFIYERLSPEMEEYYNKLRQENQIKKWIEKQKIEKNDDYLK